MNFRLENAPSNPADFQLLNTITYCTTLYTGSSWALAGSYSVAVSIDEYLNQLAQNIRYSPFERVNITRIIDVLTHKHEIGEPVSLIDIYGELAAQKIVLSDDTQTTLVAQSALISPTATPFPLYSALVGNETPEYEWVEFSPYEIRCNYLKSPILAWALGRKFNNGTSQDFSKPQTLGFFLGLWASGMCLNAQEFFAFIQPYLAQAESYVEHEAEAIEISVQSAIGSLINAFKRSESQSWQEMLLDRRLSPATVFNWTMNMPNMPFEDVPQVSLVDAGIDFGLPTPPLLEAERNVNIIIIFDSSESLVFGSELQNLTLMQTRTIFHFHQSTTLASINLYFVHWNNDIATPIVIYLPLIKNSSYENGWDPESVSFTQTDNFEYTLDQTQLLCGLTRTNMQQIQPMIIETIRQWIEVKRRAN